MMKKLLVIVAMCLSTLSYATTFPDKPVKIIINLSAGSSPDVLARKLAEQLSTKWQQPVVVENRPGGSGIVAIESYRREKDDGYSVLFGDLGAMVINPLLVDKTDLLNDIEPIAGMFTTRFVLVANPRIQNISQLHQALIATPNYGSWGVGSPAHLLGIELTEYLQVPATHVPYREFGPWLVDTSNQVQTFGFTTIGTSRALVNSNRLRWLAITGAQRDPKYPGLPTLQELTGKQVGNIQGWGAIYVKKTVPTNIKNILIQDINQVMNSDALKETVESLDYNHYSPTLGRLEKDILTQTVYYKKIITKYNIKP